MTKSANSSDKPSPADTPTKRPNDKGGKAHLRKEDKKYRAKEPHKDNIATRHENEEQPVAPIKMPPQE